MPAYHSKIFVKTQPQTIREKRFFQIDFLTIEKLQTKIGQNERFDITDIEGGYEIEVYGERLETPEEVEARVKKEIEYNSNYDKFHAKPKA